MGIVSIIKRTLGLERGISGEIRTVPAGESPKLTPEEMARMTVENEACVGFGFPDYLWARDRFIRMTMDIKGPIDGPWYCRTTVFNFVQAMAHPALPEVIRIRLKQENKEYEFDEIKKLCSEAEGIYSTLNGCCGQEPDPASIERCRTFLGRVTIRLHVIDEYFAKKYWPKDFEPRDNLDEFIGTSIETAMMHVPYMR